MIKHRVFYGRNQQDHKPNGAARFEPAPFFCPSGSALLERRVAEYRFLLSNFQIEIN